MSNYYAAKLQERQKQQMMSYSVILKKQEDKVFPYRNVQKKSKKDHLQWFETKDRLQSLVNRAENNTSMIRKSEPVKNEDQTNVQDENVEIELNADLAMTEDDQIPIDDIVS